MVGACRHSPTIIASQAVISGGFFSITRQAVQTGPVARAWKSAIPAPAEMGPDLCAQVQCPCWRSAWVLIVLIFKDFGFAGGCVRQSP